MTKQYLVIDFAECTYSIKTLSDNEIATTEASVIRWNGEDFEQQIASQRILDDDENPVEVKLLWAKVDATPEECVSLLEEFLNKN